MTASRILIIDDEPDLVWALKHTLMDEGYDVMTAFNGVDGLALAQHHQPDLIVLDIVMPQMDGVQVCLALRRQIDLAAVPILFLSRRNSIEDRIGGLDGGADDYLVKPFDFGELKARIRALLRRVSQNNLANEPEQSVLSYEDLHLDVHTRIANIGSRAVILTPSEFDLLHYFLTHQGEVCSSTRLLQEVFGYPVDLADRGLVRWHIMNLRHKIELDPNNPQYIRTVPRHGYILGGMVATNSDADKLLIP